MPLENATIAVTAFAAGGALGWFPLAAWVFRSLQREQVSRRMVSIAAAAVTAVTFAALAIRFGPSWVLLALLVFAAAATVLAMVDIIEQRLPNAVVFPALAAVTVPFLLATWEKADWAALLWAAVGAAAMFLVYFLPALVWPSSMGMGDVKLALVIGVSLGWLGLRAWLVGLFAAFVFGGIIALIMLALRRMTLRDSIPFGPAMLLGAFVSMLVVGG